jgi:hypothetical protein
MKKKRTNNSSTKPLAELVYIKAIEEQIHKRVTAKYEQRIDYLIGANNELMKELEQYEKHNTDSLSPEESQIVRMPWLKEHIQHESTL